jgi:regulator of RNase E activity RraA
VVPWAVVTGSNGLPIADGAADSAARQRSTEFPVRQRPVMIPQSQEASRAALAVRVRCSGA